VTDPTQPHRRIVVFSSPDVRASTVESVEALAAALPDARFLVVTGGVRVSRGRYIKNKLKRLGREPVSYPLELFFQMLAKLSIAKTRTVSARVAAPTLSLARVEHHPFAEIHGDDCRARVREFRPWLGIALGAPILGESLFGIPEAGTINLHKSLLPDYRGMPPAFWELKDNAKRAGVSVHWMQATLDTGDVIRQQAIDIEPFQTVSGLQASLDELGVAVLVDAVREIDAGAATASPQSTATTPTNSRPPFLLDRSVRRRLERRRRQVFGGGGVRQLIKAVLLRIHVHAWAPIRNLWRRARGECQTTILLYHRVSDRFVDRVTVGVEQFERHLRMLKRHYDVLDLATFLQSRGKPRKRPAVLLTFDDGYADNHLAARLLRREAMPCTFFVCTRIVDTDERFPHDIQKEVNGAPALSWQQVAEMASWGFDFGNHTTRHHNLARLPHEEAMRDIEDASSDLAERLNGSGAERVLAHPYGRQHNITERIREELPAAGIDYCFSAYGGVNPPDFDPMDIRREGISANVSDITLRAIVEGWRVS
jgi:peptidoglycan/xylan/chitin deacetylase (PgdA/CDA1 family)